MVNFIGKENIKSRSSEHDPVVNRCCPILIVISPILSLNAFNVSQNCTPNSDFVLIKNSNLTKQLQITVNLKLILHTRKLISQYFYPWIVLCVVQLAERKSETIFGRLHSMIHFVCTSCFWSKCCQELLDLSSCPKLRKFLSL